MVWPWQRNRDLRARGADAGVVDPDPDSGPGSGQSAESPAITSSPSPLADPGFVAGLRPIPSGSSGPSDPWPASDITGVDPSGDAVTVSVAGASGRLLLLFLSTDCDGCEEFWSRLRQSGDAGLPADVSPVVITRGPGVVTPAAVAAASEGIVVPVVMSDRAWTDYRVMGYPFLVLVDVASRSVVGEAVGMGWGDVEKLHRRER